MRRKMNIGTGLILLAVTFLFGACATVKPYEKNKINDAEMQLSMRKVEKGDREFQTITEGASGANGGKVGGGCGCN